MNTSQLDRVDRLAAMFQDPDESREVRGYQSCMATETPITVAR